MKRVLPFLLLIGLLITTLPSITSAASYTTSASVSPTTVRSGSSATIISKVKSSGKTKLLVDVEVYSPNGQKVFQKYWDNESFSANQQRTFKASWKIPTDSVTGSYTVKIGLFSPGWGTLYAWNDNASQFTVAAGTASTATPMPTTRPTNTPVPSTPTGSGRYFSTLPVGSALPSDSECAAAVKRRPENKGMNATANATRGNQTLPNTFFNSDDPRANETLAPRVTGHFVGTTDEILQWAACKWGIDEDVVRAQAVTESWWNQSAKGDWTTDESRCAPGHGLGVDGRSGQCPESFGILQNRYPYEQAAWPGIDTSTAFNADLTYAIWRGCYEGYEWWLNDVDRGQQYGSGDQWGCVGRWFAGRWHTEAAEGYIGTVQSNLSQRVWEQPNFQQP